VCSTSFFHLPRLNLLTQFTLVGAGLTFLIAIGLAILLSRQIENRSFEQAGLNASEDANILIGPLLTPADLAGDLPAERYREIDRALRPLLSRRSVIRVKIWNRDRASSTIPICRTSSARSTPMIASATPPCGAGSPAKSPPWTRRRTASSGGPITSSSK
jgi:hypothetical protein